MDENEVGLSARGVPERNEEEKEKEFYEEHGEGNEGSGGDPCGTGLYTGLCTGMCGGDNARGVEDDPMARGASGAASGASLREETEKETFFASEETVTDPVEAARREARDELGEFFELFPDVPFADIPVSVRESALPLAAAYALYERRERRRMERVERANEANRARSAGRVSDGEESFYTPDEVRRMTPAEVRADYDAILRSMKRWK
ncbi:MAG: hypothetical protein IKC26_01010 [Clostridia bacterium]|nr:hypothetical protein [Clostridia bacterium]